MVRVYSWYRAIIRKLGWTGPKKGKYRIFFDQKLIHIIVGLLTVIMVFINFTTKTKAVNINEQSRNTILAKLVASDLDKLEDDQLIEEFFDEEAVISNTQQRYLDNLMTIEPQPQIVPETAEEEEAQDLTSLTQGDSALVKPEIAATKIAKRPRAEAITYTVNPGDTVSTIAQEFEISVNTILWENNLSAYSIIRPGDKLSILPMSGITHKVAKNETIASIAKDYKVEEIEIITANKLADASQLQIGEKLLIPGGKKATYASYSPPTQTGLSALSSLVKPSGAQPATGNKMNWPTEGHNITQYYSWRHHAVDIANKYGTAIYAADAGTIEVIGWGTGYGNQIVIDHGGGKKTRYAHLSKFYVDKGQSVSKGESIAAMGSTGWSTGSHLHFEVIINGVKYNPLNYIK